MVLIRIWVPASGSPSGAGICSRIVSNKGVISLFFTVRFKVAVPALAEAYTNGQSSCSSLASRSIKSSSTSSTRASGRSHLLMQTMTDRFSSKAFLSTNFVCGIGPSKASTTRMTPFTIFSTRSTSPPKSACPGVSIILIFVPLYMTAVFLERIVIPRSRSMALLSMTRSATSWFSRNTPLCFKSSSTRVVLPWSTCAMIATFLTSSLFCLIKNLLKYRKQQFYCSLFQTHLV